MKRQLTISFLSTLCLYCAGCARGHDIEKVSFRFVSEHSNVLPVVGQPSTEFSIDINGQISVVYWQNAPTGSGGLRIEFEVIDEATATLVIDYAANHFTDFRKEIDIRNPHIMVTTVSPPHQHLIGFPDDLPEDVREALRKIAATRLNPLLMPEQLID